MRSDTQPGELQPAVAQYQLTLVGATGIVSTIRFGAAPLDDVWVFSRSTTSDLNVPTVVSSTGHVVDGGATNASVVVTYIGRSTYTVTAANFAVSMELPM